MKDIKKLMITLVALLAVTTGAWADEITVTWSSGDTYENNNSKDGVTLSGDIVRLVGEEWQLAYDEEKGTFTTELGNFTNIEINGGYIDGFSGEGWSGSTWTGNAAAVPFEGYLTDDYGGKPWTITFTIESASSEPEPEPGAASAVEVDWNKTSKTGTFDMPGGNVELEPEYYPQAALTAEPTAINDVPATTDGAIVEAGTVANIDGTTNAQGTVMYYVSPTALDDAALLALAADAWTADVPTAENLTEGPAYVYYYVRGNDGDTDETTFSDGDIVKAVNALTVTIAAAPTYAVTFADDLAEPDKWTASPAANVKKGDKVTVTYTGSKKVLGVKAEKKAAAATPTLAEATASDYGKVVCDKGHLHDAKTAVPTGCTAVAVFAYIDGGNNRIAIALQDGEAATWYTLTTDGANNNTLCSVPGTWTVTAPTDAEWFVGTKAIYEAIFTNLGSTTGDSDGKTYDDNVNAYITTVGGKALSSGYWSTSEKSESIGWDFGSGYWYNDYKTYGLKVRPVLAW